MAGLIFLFFQPGAPVVEQEDFHMAALSNFSGVSGSPIAPAGGVVAGTVYLVQNTLYLALNTVPATLPFQGFVLFTGQSNKLLQFAPKATGQVWAAGQNIYWDNTAKNFTTTLTSNTLIGIAANAQASGDVLADIILGKQL